MLPQPSYCSAGHPTAMLALWTHSTRRAPGGLPARLVSTACTGEHCLREKQDQEREHVLRIDAQQGRAQLQSAASRMVCNMRL